MIEEELQKRILIQRIIENPLFDGIKKDLRAQMMEEMMLEKNAERRNELFWEAQALDRVMGRLNALANEARMLKKDVA